MLETLVFVGISLILLIPIVYVLPLSLTVRGKLIIIGGAVVVALAGLVAANIYPLWQALLFLTMLLFLALFFIGKKIGPFMLSTQAEPESVYEQTDEFRFGESTSERDTLVEDPKAGYHEEVDFEIKEHIAASEETTLELDGPPVFELDAITSQPIKLDEADGIPKIEVASRGDLLVEGTEEPELEEIEILPEIELPTISEKSELEQLLEEETEEPGMEEMESLPEIELPTISEISELERLLEEGTEEPELEEIEILPEIEVPTVSEISELERLLEEGTEESELEEIEILPEIEVSTESEKSDLERLLEEGTEEPELEEIEVLPEIEVPTVSEISELERLLEEETEESEMEEIKILPEIEVSTENEISELERLLEEGTGESEMEEMKGLPEIEVSAESNLSELEELLEEPVELFAKEDELSPVMQQELQEDMESVVHLEEEYIPPTELEQIEELSEHDWNSDAEISEDDLIDTDSPILEEDYTLPLESALSEELEIEPASIIKEEQMQTDFGSEWQQQIFQTMVSHIQIAQHQMKDSEFEQLVMSHLQPNIPDQQYYIFASFLIQRYMTTNKTEQLHELISHLKEKFSSHPILLQELEFMESRFC